MKNRPGERGRSKIAGPVFAAGLTLAMGYAFGVFTLGGCGGSQAGFAPPADGQLPERVVEKLTSCAKRGPVPLQPVKHAVSYDVLMNPDGQVEEVALRDSTFHIDEVEACMADALHALSERAMNLSPRRREPARPASVPPTARVLFANPIAIAVGVAEVVLVVGLMAVTVVVYYQVVHNTTTHRPPPPKPQVEEPPKPDKDPKPEPQGTTGPTPPVPPEPPEPPKPKPRCEVAFPGVVNCSYIQQAKYPDRKSALEAAIKSLPKEWQKRPFTTNGTKPSDRLPGADHTTYWSADGKTKISIGCYTSCCRDTNDGPVIEEGMKCYELNQERAHSRR